MKFLAGTVDLPYVTPVGQLVCRPGYNPKTKLYTELPYDYTPRIPPKPSSDDVRRAVVEMMGPWRDYRFTSPDGAAAMVCAVIMAVVRPMLSQAPGILIDASQQGSGKTKAASALGAVIEGRMPAVTPYAGAGGAEETAKWLIAGALAGARFHLVDNVTGHLKDTALAGVLTTGRMGGRVLGQSRHVDTNIDALIALTGNNSSCDADLQRRLMHIRIDGGNNPTHRSFAFCPVNEALRKRVTIAEAVCTVLVAYFNAGAPDVVKGDAGGFADWNRLCRQPTLWLAREGLADGLPWTLGDPAASMMADPTKGDPELEATGDLLRALRELSKGDVFTSAEVVRWVGMGASGSGLHVDLRLAVSECTGRIELSARSMGRVLMNRRDRAVGGLKLLQREEKTNTSAWRVVEVAAGF